MAIPQGTKLGHHEIDSLLGAGGMGEVYLAHDLNLRRQSAVKVLRADLTADKGRLQRFEREAHTASSLNHPNILTIYEIGHQDDCHFIVTEFVDGESLGHHLQLEPLKLLEVLDIVIQVASALAAAHAAGIVHRDIKPDNIMLRRDGLVKVVDFGLAKLGELANADPDTQTPNESLFATKPGVVMGTPAYMSPEQARGLPVDVRTDIWSLGVVLYKMVTGILPFAGPTMSDMLVAILNTNPPALTGSVPNAPAELERIVNKALRKNPDERYQRVEDLEVDLKNLRQRLRFETELGLSGRAERPSQAAGEGSRADTIPKPAQKTDRTIAGYGTLSIGRANQRLYTTSSAESVVRFIKRHRREALLILGIVIAATIIAALIANRTGKVGINSLAVLPFKNMSSDPANEYLSDGITDNLISRLSQLSGMKVIANTSSSRYKGKDADPQEVASALDVTAIVTGRVTQVDDSLLINVELVNARDRMQLWGEQYNRKLDDLSSVPIEISAKIAQTLRPRLSPSTRQQVEAREKVNPQAYELLLKGRFSRSRGGAEDRKKAADYFNQAINIDPSYALAYAELSITYWSLVSSSTLDPKEYSPKAEALARKALDLDEHLAEAHYALANLKTDAWEWADADAKYQRAIELNPNLALAHRWYANFLTLMGRHDQAIAEIKLARQLDPLSLPVSAIVGYTYYEARQYDQAIEALNKTLEQDQNFPYAHLFYGYTYAAKGLYPQAIAEYQEAIRLGRDTPSRQIFLGAAYAAAGDRDRAQAILMRLQTSKEYVSPGELAVLLAALGERDQAFASLERAYEAHDLQLQYLGVSPTFDPLRSDPRFQNLLRRVGLAR